jgi:hypothetical protein
MKPILVAVLFVAATIAVGFMAADDTQGVVVKKPFDGNVAKGHSKGGTPQIFWHGGSVLNQGMVPVYVIYYGSNFPSSTQDIVNAFLAGLTLRPQYQVNTTYCEFQTTDCATNSPSTAISGLLDFSVPSHVYSDSGSQGNTINSGGVLKILQHAFATTTLGHLPTDDGAVYFVITSPDIKVHGFCSSFCAYHTRSTSVVSGKTIQYAFIPEPGPKCTACDGNFALGETTTPNGDPGADEMVDSIMHELSESVTDPDLNAWYTSNGEENGDLCNYNYGTPLFLHNGASYNVAWNGYYYLIQLIWKNGPIPQSCAAAP